MVTIENAPVISKKQPLPIAGRFSPYVAPYLRLILPLLTARYIVEATERINPGDVLKKSVGFENRHYWQKNFFALGWGAIASTVTGIYTYQTYKDIRTILAEAAGYEFNKAPKNIGFWDLQRSRNPLVETTMKALISRTAMRFAAVFTLFLPWHKLNRIKRGAPRYDPEGAMGANPRMGTGILATYLFMDSFTRKQSLFEVLQETVSQKINHSNDNPYDVIGVDDIGRMMTIYRHSKDKAYQPPLPSSQAAQEDIALSARIADMMNRTYSNATNLENVDLTLGKFLYLLGNGMLDSFPESLGYVELANRSKDMKSVKKVADFIKNGGNPEQVFPDIYKIIEKAEMEATKPPQTNHTQDEIKQIIATGTSSYQEKLASSQASPVQGRM